MSHILRMQGTESSSKLAEPTAVLCKWCHHLLSHSHQEFSLWSAILQIVKILLPTCFSGLSPPLQPQALVQLLAILFARDSLSPLAGLPPPALSPQSYPHWDASCCSPADSPPRFPITPGKRPGLSALHTNPSMNCSLSCSHDMSCHVPKLCPIHVHLLLGLQYSTRGLFADLL